VLDSENASARRGGAGGVKHTTKSERRLASMTKDGALKTRAAFEEIIISVADNIPSAKVNE
jgi:hypothetical protein